VALSSRGLQVYRELRLTDVYQAQETASKKRVEALVEPSSSHPRAHTCSLQIKEASPTLPAGLFTPILKKIHNRQK
jgi:hypothetical protein